MLRANDLLSSPVGCDFLQAIVDTGLTVDQALSVPTVFDLVHHSLLVMMPWCAEEDDLDRALEQGARLVDLADEVAAHADAQWWIDPLARDAQLWVGSEEPDFSAPSPEQSDPYFQIPRGSNRFTSTIRDGSSFVTSAAEQQSGEVLYEPPIHRRTFRVQLQARVFEVTGPRTWHELCVAHPDTDPGHNHPYGTGMLVPDWTSVARSYDGVHITIGALLTASHIRVESDAGWTYLWAHETEATYWVKDVLVYERSISDITEFMHDAPPNEDGRYIDFRVSDRGYSAIRSWAYARQHGRSEDLLE